MNMESNSFGPDEDSDGNTGFDDADEDDTPSPSAKSDIPSQDDDLLSAYLKPDDVSIVVKSEGAIERLLNAYDFINHALPHDPKCNCNECLLPRNARAEFAQMQQEIDRLMRVEVKRIIEVRDKDAAPVLTSTIPPKIDMKEEHIDSVAMKGAKP